MTYINHILLLLIVANIISCTKDKGVKVEKIEIIDETQVPEVLKNGERAALQLLDSLKAELMNVLQTDGAIAAIDVCSKKAIQITSSISKDLNVKLKRTSSRYRNTLNKPDEYEESALRYFEQKFKNDGILPMSYIQRISLNEGVFYNYYKPIKISQTCVLCHGTTETMSAELIKAILSRYPDDKARNYNVGDFRGLVRVRIEGKNQN